VLQQLANTFTQRVGLPYLARGDVFEPTGTNAQAGARFIDSLLGGNPKKNPPVPRLSRPLLAADRVHARAGADTAVRVRFSAVAPGADWGVVGREGSPVAVYVDGVYHSTVVVTSERAKAGAAQYEVALGGLPPGQHTIEIRDARDRTGGPTGIRVTKIDTHVLRGEQALIDRHAPLLQTRSLPNDNRAEITHTDTPMLLVPKVTKTADGTTTIEYHVLYSNEDGGTGTVDLYRRYGRGVDFEWTYRVKLDAAGNKLKGEFQGPLHRTVDFSGTYSGERPVLRISTSNNNASQRLNTQPNADRWSEAPIAAVRQGVTELSIMRSQPWTLAIMGKELLREGRTTVFGSAPAASQIDDPRSYVYLHAETQQGRTAMKAGTTVTLHLRNGKTATLEVKAANFGYGTATALALPDGVRPEDIVRVSGPVSAFVLDAKFAPRSLDAAPQVRRRSAA
jgi:hypothetical protein